VLTGARERKHQERYGEARREWGAAEVWRVEKLFLYKWGTLERKTGGRGRGGGVKKKQEGDENKRGDLGRDYQAKKNIYGS